MSTSVELGRVIFKRKGDYSNVTTYKKLDIVKYQGRDFIATQDTTGNTPPNTNTSNVYWQLVSGAGSYQPSLSSDGILS